MTKCIDGNNIEDPDVRQALQHFGLEESVLEIAYLTLLALFILEEVFIDNEDEWQMIARNARNYLESIGV